MKIGNMRPVVFKSDLTAQRQEKSDNSQSKNITELGIQTPDFGVSVPQSYSKLGSAKLPNGLEIHFYKLANGHKVTIIPMEDSPAVVKNYVNVGSLNESPEIKGISHFLEHMAFNGTWGENGHIKLETGDSFQKIEELGGWANASTNYAVTDYVNSSPLLGDKDLETQIKVIAAMTEDLKLSSKMIEKEKHAVCSEINMILDDPETIAVDQTVRTLFNIKNPADELVGGSVRHIQNLTRKDVKDYYDKYYTPDNMNLVITGDVVPDEVITLVSKNFKSQKTPQGVKYEEKLTPMDKTVRKDFISDKAVESTIVVGFKGPKNNDARGQVLLDVVSDYLDYGGLYRNLRQYNAYRSIGCEKIGTNPHSPQMLYIMTSTADKNTEKALQTIFDTVAALPKPAEKELHNIKERLADARENSLQYSLNVNGMAGNAILDGNIEYLTEYNNILNSITPEEVQNALKEYFNLDRAAITVVHPENKEVSFKGKGKTRQPLNLDNISEYKLSNNYDAGFYKTKNNYMYYRINLETVRPYNRKAGAAEVLDEIYSIMINEKLNDFQKENNVGLTCIFNTNGVFCHTKGRGEKRELLMKMAEELLYNPDLSQENLDKAKERVKDRILRNQRTAYDLYYNNEQGNDPYGFTDEEILSSLDGITLDDLRECHKYLLENSSGTVAANLPENNTEQVKNDILNAANRLKGVQPKTFEELKVYDYIKNEDSPKVLTEVNNNSQADILQVHKFKYEDTLKDNLLLRLTSSILSSSSIGLFDNLREKEHLAYSVHASGSRYGDCGTIECNILTTTDNKDSGEHSYDNVQKSIEGFNNQINELLSGNFTDSDLENAKLKIKADLLDNEGVSGKLWAIDGGIGSKYGITLDNQKFNTIDSITKEDIIDFARKAFKNPPVYAITASSDTLKYNKDYLAELEG